jgi:cytochrome c-type biogenesis protein CcmF
MTIGGYTLVCRSSTQDDKPNYASDWAIIDVYKGGKQIATMYPEKRVYKASNQPATIVANRSTLTEDLYLVYSGMNEATGNPIIKAHVNPLVLWIWIGAHLMLLGTVLALIPSKATAMRLRVPALEKAMAEHAGSSVGAGD